MDIGPSSRGTTAVFKAWLLLCYDLHVIMQNNMHNLGRYYSISTFKRSGMNEKLKTRDVASLQRECLSDVLMTMIERFTTNFSTKYHCHF